MVSFVYYDIAFLILFCLFVAGFLYKNRKKVEVESKIILLYKTRMGLDSIDYVGRKHPKVLSFLSIFVVIAGYVMMAFSIIFFLASTLMILTASSLPKIPPLIPLVPYIDKLLPAGILPPFYFTYWIIVIGIVAVAHEFAHGIFAKLKGVRIKSTGFGFIGPLLAAFVEIDEKQMAKKPIKDQLTVLAAGPSANLLLWFIFFLITSLFFTVAFVPNGVGFSTFLLDNANYSDIGMIDGKAVSVSNFSEFYAVAGELNKSSIEIDSGNATYFTNPYVLGMQKTAADSGIELSSVVVYQDTPAYHANLSGSIQKITFEDGSKEYKITNLESLQFALNGSKPGQKVSIETTAGNYSLTMGVSSENSSVGLLGIGFMKPQYTWIGKITKFFSYKDAFVNYSPRGNSTGGDMILFVYHLLYWLMIINFFVMLFNMLPVGIVDGGRFFYLSALALTKSEKKANRWFTAVTYLILLAFFAIMVSWFFKAF